MKRKEKHPKAAHKTISDECISIFTTPGAPPPDTHTRADNLTD